MQGSMNIRYCADAEALRLAIPDVGLELVAGSANPYPLRVTRIPLGETVLQRLEESGSSLGIVQVPEDRCLVVFPIRLAAGQAWQGIVLKPGELMLVAPGTRLHHAMQGAGAWGWLAIHPKKLVDWYRTLSGDPIELPVSEAVFRPDRTALGKLLRIEEEATLLAGSNPSLLTLPEIARALDSELIYSLTACLTALAVHIEPSRKRLARLRQLRLMNRFEDSLTTQAAQQLSIDELADGLGCSVRALRAISLCFSGMTPHDYELAIRLRALRAVLSEADPARDTVAGLARSLGFDQAGRVAALYRRAFGELPSATLGRDHHGDEKTYKR